MTQGDQKYPIWVVSCFLSDILKFTAGGICMYTTSWKASKRTIFVSSYRFTIDRFVLVGFLIIHIYCHVRESIEFFTIPTALFGDWSAVISSILFGPLSSPQFWLVRCQLLTSQGSAVKKYTRPDPYRYSIIQILRLSTGKFCHGVNRLHELILSPHTKIYMWDKHDVSFSLDNKIF